MERNSHTSPGYKIESQIREAYGRVVYTETCHNKIINILRSRDNNIKIIQIVLSAITTGSFLVTIFSSENIAGIIGAICSIVLLMLNAYVKDFNLQEMIREHQNASDVLWKIREEYITLLTDFELLEQKEIREKRDDLQVRTSKIYSSSPKTNKKSYKLAQKALKIDEEQTFSDLEIDLMLPSAIRRNNSKHC